MVFNTIEEGHVSNRKRGKVVILLKEVLIQTRCCILKIRDFVEQKPEQAEALELFTFTEKPLEIDDLLFDLDCAIATIDKLGI